MEEPAHFQPTYEHKNWHWLLWLGGFTAFVFLGAFVYFWMHQSAPANTPVTTAPLNAEQTNSLTKFTLSNGWATPFSKDSNNVYFNDQVIEGADPNSFVFIDASGGDIISGYYAKDMSHVYFSDNAGESLTVLQDADPSTFGLVPFYTNTKGIVVQDASCGGNCYYEAQDKNHKYLDGQIVQ